MSWPRFVGCIHLSPLPGSARGGNAASLVDILDRARRDAEAYAEGGAEALIVENFGDVPFAKGAVESHVVAAMTQAVLVVQEASGLPVGVNVLRNDVHSAVAVAAMTGARFVRANVYVGAALTDQGIIEGQAQSVQRLIKRLGAQVEVWADVDVKHAAQLAQRPMTELAKDAIERGLADALIVTGSGTGVATDLAQVDLVRSACPRSPVYVGSGVTVATAKETATRASGCIIGSAAKVDGLATNAVDVNRVRQIASAIFG